ncbi:MAG TPA: hypothetical protein VFB25_02660 [Gaiellaceae bacterium]|nr:hypothetical protein [Gaiellaceae bacterium]
MNPRRLFATLAVAVTVAAVAAGAGGSAAKRGLSCTVQEGTVVAYSPSARHSCAAGISAGAVLRRTETVQTGYPGQLTFHTNHLMRCIELNSAPKGTADVIMPSKSIALQHVRGTTWCLHGPTDPAVTLTAPGATIVLGGTLFGVQTDATGSTVQVADGSATVRSTATRSSVTVGAGFQALIPPTGKPSAPVPLQLAETAQQAVFFLQFNVVPMGVAQPLAFVKQQKEKSAVVVASDGVALKTEAPFLNGLETRTFSAEQAQADPGAVLKGATALKTRVILAVGDFEALEPALTALSAAITTPMTLAYAAKPVG